MTFGERRKRANTRLIEKDFERIESTFLSFARKLNKKRQAQMIKRVERILPELLKANESGKKEEVRGVLKSLKMPSSKEWRKGIQNLVQSSVEAGILRAHLEVLNLKERYEFKNTWLPKIIDEGYNYDVNIPKDALEFIRNHSYSVGVITEETVIRRIRGELERGLKEGLTPDEMTREVKRVVGSWISDHHAQTIARTESGKFYNAGRLARWTDPELGNFVEALQYDAILDRRTTPVCRHLDGKIIPIHNQAIISRYTPPNHFQCRSTWLPVTMYEEWKPTFDTTIPPEKGFTFESPLPKLLRGKTGPLVKPKRKFDPRKVTDPKIIRSLADDDFKVAIKNVSDTKLKLSLVKERAEQMLIRDNGLKETRAERFIFSGVTRSNTRGEFFVGKTRRAFYFDPSTYDEVKAFSDELKKATTHDEAKKLFKSFRKKNGKNPRMLPFIYSMDRALLESYVSMTWDGLNPVKRSTEAKKLFTFKMPPRTVNFKAATGLQQALKEGQEWIMKYLDDSLMPAKTGIKVRFKHNLDRAYAIGEEGTIHFGAINRKAGVVVHEAAHVLHWNHESLLELIGEFFHQRTKDDIMTLYQNEKVKRDAFYSPYVGRVYGFEKRLINAYGVSFYGQEVFSMGLQAMMETPEKFYREDKEHFLLTYAIIRGLF